VLPDPNGDAPNRGRKSFETVLRRKGSGFIPLDDTPIHYPFKLGQQVEEIIVVRRDVV
jgi:hypothetical protein